MEEEGKKERRNGEQKERRKEGKTARTLPGGSPDAPRRFPGGFRLLDPEPREGERSEPTPKSTFGRLKALLKLQVEVQQVLIQIF